MTNPTINPSSFGDNQESVFNFYPSIVSLLLCLGIYQGGYNMAEEDLEIELQYEQHGLLWAMFYSLVPRSVSTQFMRPRATLFNPVPQNPDAEHDDNDEQHSRLHNQEMP